MSPHFRSALSAATAAMANRSDLSESEKPNKNDGITQGEVQRMIQDLDASFTKKLEALSNVVTRAITSGTDSQSHDQSNDEPPKKKQKTKSKANDVLVCDSPDLDELEANLLQDDDSDTANNDSPDTDSDLLETIATELSTEEKLGSKIDEKLAGIVDGRFKAKLTPELQKAKFETYNRPENCENLVVPTVNAEIWNKLPQEAMKADLKLQHIQRAVVKAATATARAAELLLQAKKTASVSSVSDKFNQAVRNCTDSIALCGHASREISIRRRHAIRPHLNKQVTRICDESVPITTKLFGDNLSTTLKEVKEADRIGAGARDVDRRHRFPANRYNTPFHGRGGFLGRGRHHNKRQWGQQRRGSYRGRQNAGSSLSQ